jgi:hypothetical protein
LLQGSRLITDSESRYPAQRALAPLERRKQDRIAQQLCALSRKYGLASREMSLVAVVKRAGDRPGEIPETRVVPLGVPQDVDIQAYLPPPPLLAYMAGPDNEPRSTVATPGFFQMLRRQRAVPAQPAANSPDDSLMDLASQLEPDGGMPGANASERAARSVAVLLAFVSAGHTLTAGAFRSHVARLAEYLKSTKVPDRETIDLALAAARSGKVPPGDWLAIARTPGVPWRKVEKALAV